MKYTIKQLARSAALSGLAAILLGCGGGGGNPNVTEADGRAQVRTRLMADKNASRIVDFVEDPDVWINNSQILADFEVERNDGFFAYVEYTSPSDNRTTAQNEIQQLFDNGIDYLYAGPASAAAVGTTVQNYSNAGYIGQIPTP